MPKGKHPLLPFARSDRLGDNSVAGEDRKAGGWISLAVSLGEE
jgi:hypothetical protein